MDLLHRYTYIDRLLMHNAACILSGSSARVCLALPLKLNSALFVKQSHKLR
jgi:hypothetical protein